MPTALSQFAAFTHDANGNLTSDGANSYSYDIENRLISVSGAHTATLDYDLLGRLRRISGGPSGDVRFVHDGDALVAEYSGSGSLLARYVHGAGADTPLVWYDGGTVSNTTRRHLLADHQGSIIGISDYDGDLINPNRYDVWGVGDPSNIGRFGYTGQAYLSDIGLYYYRARIYAPEWGRFLQTDPIGYEDNLNLYAYVGNDPVNLVDPSGLRAIVTRNGRIIISPERSSIPRITIPGVRGAGGFSFSEGAWHGYPLATPSLQSNPGAVGRAIRMNPTPGVNDSPATLSGTRNNVGRLVFWDGGTNYVMCFAVTSPDPARFTDITVNYTINSEHALGEGFVMRYGEIVDGSVTRIVTYGEGNSPWQDMALEPIWGPIVRDTWRALDQEIGLTQ